MCYWEMVWCMQQGQKKKQWKRKHEDFIETIRAAREYDAAAKTGTVMDDYYCPSVGNHGNEGFSWLINNECIWHWHYTLFQCRDPCRSTRALSSRSRLRPVPILQAPVPGACSREAHSILQGTEWPHWEKSQRQQLFCPHKEVEVQAPFAKETHWNRRISLV